MPHFYTVLDDCETYTAAESSMVVFLDVESMDPKYQEDATDVVENQEGKALKRLIYKYQELQQTGREMPGMQIISVSYLLECEVKLLEVQNILRDKVIGDPDKVLCILQALDMI